jgi:DUF4097 and DUF4098 domain-containing protein YvlB
MRTSLNRFFAVAALAAAVVLVFTVSDSAAKVYETIDQTIDFNSGGRFTIENVNGSITIETWDQEQVRIEAEKTASSQEALDDIEVEISGSGGEVNVRTHFPRHNRRGESRAVEYHITLPVEADIDVETVNGKVEIYGVRGRQMKAETTNGSVEVEDIAGESDISTTNGSIKARYTDVFPGSYHFSTTNGSVTLDLPPGAGGELDARTVNGSITTDFPATVRSLSKRHLQGTFGGGGGFFEISTVNGSVRIRER